MALTITAMNATAVLTHSSLYPAGVRIEGFAPDSAIQIDEAESGVAQMGVDGKMSVGRVPYITNVTFTLAADSASNTIFDVIEGFQKTQREISICNLVLNLPSIQRAYTLTKCVITNITPMAPVQRVLGQRTYRLACERCDSAALRG